MRKNELNCRLESRIINALTRTIQHPNPLPGDLQVCSSELWYSPAYLQPEVRYVCSIQAGPVPGENPLEIEQVKQWQCMVCGFIYDEALGLPEEGIAPGTPWSELPDDWMCPDCGVGKEDFEMIEI